MQNEKSKLVYKVYNDNTHKHIFDIYYSPLTNEYSVELLEKTGLPILLCEIDFDTGRVIQAARPNPKSEYILNWLKDRVIPPNRDMLKEILEANGLYEYNWKELIKLNHGRCTDDYFSVEAVEN